MINFSRYARLPRGVWLLSLGQGLGLTAAVISVSVAALAGASLCNEPAFATLPYGLQFLATMFAGPLGSIAMERAGRRAVFFAAAFLGVMAGVVGTVAVRQEDFILLCVSHTLLGCFLGNVNLFRFASLDMVEENRRPTAMSLVLFGGVFASLLGPIMVRQAPDWLGASAFESAYLVIGACGLSVMLLLFFVHPPQNRNAVPTVSPSDPESTFVFMPPYLLALGAGGLGYGLMNLLMISSSLDMQMKNIPFAHVSYAIQLHVFCMFFPSFLAGILINRLGIYPFLMLGVGLQIAAGIAALLLSGYLGFITSLVILGLAWNVLYVGGSHLVGQCVNGPRRFRAQGINELVVGLFATFGAIFAGWLLAALGWEMLNIAAIIVVAVLGGFVVFVGRQEMATARRLAR